MTVEDAAVQIVAACQDLNIPVMVVGSLSCNFYGIPRSTNDADLVVQLEAGQLSELARRLTPTFRLDPQPGFETITGTSKYQLEVADQTFFVELFALSEDEHDRERFSRRRQESMKGHPIWLPTPEDVIVMKLRWYERGGRSKDWEDTRSVMAVQIDKLDWPYIESWCDRHGSRKHLDEVRKAVRDPGE
jgi:hypothetical protein